MPNFAYFLISPHCGWNRNLKVKLRPKDKVAFWINLLSEMKLRMLEYLKKESRGAQGTRIWYTLCSQIWLISWDIIGHETKVQIDVQTGVQQGIIYSYLYCAVSKCQLGNYLIMGHSNFFIFIFFNFVMLLKWQSSIWIFSQIWQYSKYESKKILSTLFMLWAVVAVFCNFLFFPFWWFFL